MNKNDFWEKLSQEAREKVKKMNENRNEASDYDIKAVIFGLYRNCALECKGIDNAEEYMEVMAPDDFVERIYEMQELGEIKLDEGDNYED